MLKQYITIPENLWTNIYHTGSSIICNPPVLDTDIDYVIYTKSKGLIPWLISKGFISASSEDYSMNEDGLFTSLRKDKLNLIIVQEYRFYLRWVRATELAKKLNLKEKQQRIDLFSHILYPLYDC